MKNIVCILALALIVVSCKENAKETSDVAVNESQEIAYASFGKEIDASDASPASDMMAQYTKMTIGDTISTKMVAKVDEVCQAKGCWMKLELADGEQVMVKFKDYGFFMPKDIAGKEVIVNGKAFVNEVPVDEQRHYAEDAGASAEEIAMITEPKKTFSFEADGVLLKEE